MLTGTGAYDSINVAFTFRSSQHVRIQDGCVNCHNHHVPFEEGSVAYTGHEFKPTVAACQPCHGTLTDFADIKAKDDYDGNGAVGGVQDEVTGLLEILKEKVIEATPDDSTADLAAIQAAWSEPGLPNLATVLGNKTITTKEQRKAAYNWMFVEFDQSHGVHNATYAIQLLQQSILFIDPLGLQRASILIE
jgi:formate-dependent nitrite reductase cytochrome c552 subunit